MKWLFIFGIVFLLNVFAVASCIAAASPLSRSLPPRHSPLNILIKNIEYMNEESINLYPDKKRGV